MPDDVLIPPVESASSATGSLRGGHASPRGEVEVPPQRDKFSRESPPREEQCTMTPGEERDAECQRAVQAVRDITTTGKATTESEDQKYDWDALCDEPLGLPEELPARVSDPGTPPREGEETAPELLMPRGLLPTLVPPTEGRALIEGERHQKDGPHTQSTIRKSRIPTPTPRRTMAMRDNEERYGLGSVAWGREQYPSRETSDATTESKRRPATGRYRSTPTGHPNIMMLNPSV